MPAAPTADPTVAWVWTLFNLGVLGIVFWLVLTGRLITEGHKNEIISRAERAEARDSQSNALLKDLTGVTGRLTEKIDDLIQLVRPHPPSRRG